MSASSSSLYLENDWSSRWLEELGVRLSPRFFSYQPYLQIEHETSSYRLKTAESIGELLQAFELRHQSFLSDLPTNEAASFDIDDLDHQCDHLIIIDKQTDKVVGTYRIFNSLTCPKFYSEGEFNLDQFLTLEGVKLELGRACIDPSHGNGLVIDLLWKGIGRYIQATNAAYLFGCTSVYLTDPAKALGLYEDMQARGWVDHSFGIMPREKHQMHLNKIEALGERETFDSKKYIPALLRSYVSAGTKIHGHPALDNEFECIDFLTVLEINKMSSAFKRRYFK